MSVCVSTSLECRIYSRGIDITNNIFSVIKRKECSCKTWSLLNDILKASNEFITEPQDVQKDDIHYRSYLKTAKETLKTCQSMEFSNNSIKSRIEFLEEQIGLLLTEAPRYSSRMLVWACTLSFTNTAGYTALRNSNVLTLPNKRYLDTFKIKLGCDNSGISEKHYAYLSKKKSCLNDNELFVNLLLDEVYVKRDVTYKAGKIKGMVVKKSGPEAEETVQTFMISSIMSNYKDVVGLFPQTHVSGEGLYLLVQKIIELLSSIGFNIVSIICDNNRVNRKMFEMLCGGTIKESINNPYNEDTIFLLFDTVHIFKCIRNNWLNQRDSQQTFKFPEPEILLNQISTTEQDPNTMIYPQNCMFARVSDLKEVYNFEQNNVVKLAPALSQKVLYPSNIERQNVALCTKFFDEKNVSALEVLFKEEANGTCQLIKVVLNWWKIVNTKSTTIGIKSRDVFKQPIKSEEDAAIVFLDSFVQWLNEWSSFDSAGEKKKQGSFCGKLSNETQFSLNHTTQTLVAMCKHLLQTKTLQYVLLGKFQNDEIEERFG